MPTYRKYYFKQMVRSAKALLTYTKGFILNKRVK